MSHRKSIFVIGYGNPTRLDDGLGPLAIEMIRDKEISDVTLETCMLINVEHAESISAHDVVVFVDADISGSEPFYFKRIEPKELTNFKSHHSSPENLLGLAHTLYHAQTIGFVMGIRGYSFDGFGEKISKQAQNNLNDAVSFLADRLYSQGFSDISNDH